MHPDQDACRQRARPMWLRRGAEYGFDVTGDVRVDMKRVKARKDEVSGRSNRGVRIGYEGSIIVR